MSELLNPKAFGVLSRYTRGEYELFLEDEDSNLYRFEMGFDELVQLAKMSLALVPKDRLK